MKKEPLYIGLGWKMFEKLKIPLDLASPVSRSHQKNRKKNGFASVIGIEVQIKVGQYLGSVGQFLGSKLRSKLTRFEDLRLKLG